MLTGRSTALRVALVGALALPVTTASTNTSQEGATTTLTLAWDANHEPNVSGYFLYVGTRSRVYTERRDVGHVTTFTYRGGVPGQRYFFAVSAYTDEGIEGPKSNEVVETLARSTATSRASTPLTPSPEDLRPASRTQIPAGTSSPVLTCVGPDPSDCYSVHERTVGLGQVNALAVDEAGRLFLIEDGRRVLVVARGGAVTLAFEPDDADTRLTGLVIDPAFTQTRRVFIAATTKEPDGSRELRIARYRELQGVLGEGAAIISGLTLRDGREMPFAIDDRGRIYVAMPGGDGTRVDPFAGQVIRFDSDGAVPAGSRGASPVYGEGYRLPTALAWDGARLWVAGSDRLHRPLSVLNVDPSGDATWPIALIGSSLAFSASSMSMPPVAIAASVDSPPHPPDSALPSRVMCPPALEATRSSPRLFIIDGANQLYRSGPADLGGEAACGLDQLTLPNGDVPVAVSVGPDEEIYVAVRRGSSHAVLELVPRP